MGLSRRDIGVYVFLFTQKWFEKNTVFSASGISKKLNPISSLLPEEYRTTYSEKSVGNSLVKLVTLGFVTECQNNKKTKSGGRPAEILYETVKLTTLKEKIESILDGYKKSVLHTISPFEAIEEGISLKEGKSDAQ